MVDWRKAIQGIGSSWYLKAEEFSTVIPSDVLALSLMSGNKRKKKVVIGKKANSQKKAQSIEEDSYNTVLKLAIKEEKKNKIQKLASGKDQDE